MNVRLLRMAYRFKGTRRWAVPGFGNGVVLTPSHRTAPDWGPSLHWPGRDAKGEFIRGVDLDRHRALALTCVRELLARVPE